MVKEDYNPTTDDIQPRTPDVMDISTDIADFALEILEEQLLGEQRNDLGIILLKDNEVTTICFLNCYSWQQSYTGTYRWREQLWMPRMFVSHYTI